MAPQTKGRVAPAPFLHSSSQLVECGVQLARRLACPKYGVVGFRKAEAHPGFWIATKARPLGFYAKGTEAAQLHSIAPDQCGFDLVENGIDDPFHVFVEQVRILLCDALHQL